MIAADTPAESYPIGPLAEIKECLKNKNIRHAISIARKIADDSIRKIDPRIREECWNAVLQYMRAEHAAGTLHVEQYDIEEYWVDTEVSYAISIDELCSLVEASNATIRISDIIVFSPNITECGAYKKAAVFELQWMSQRKAEISKKFEENNAVIAKMRALLHELDEESFDGQPEEIPQEFIGFERKEADTYLKDNLTQIFGDAKSLKM